MIIDNREVEVPEGSTVLQAARKLGIEIPTLCHREDLPPSTSCLVCVVRIKGAERLLPSCATVVEEGMVVESETAEVREARRTALELLLGDHLGDCLGPCQLACPAGLDVPQMLRAIAAGDTERAASRARASLVLPAVLGRICPAPCERACRRGQIDEALAIRALHRQLGDRELSAGENRAAASTGGGDGGAGRGVAIVGAGPAGIAAAAQLRRAGLQVTLFDEQRQPGGMLRHPEVAQRLHPDLLDAEIGFVLDQGVQMRLGEHIDAARLAELGQEFAAVLIATGEATEASASELGLARSGRGLRVDPNTQMTERPGVFAAGGAVSPGRLAVRAVASGKRAAQAICAYIKGEPVTLEGRPFNVSMGRLSAEELWAYAQGTPKGGRVVASGGGMRGYNEAEAAAEASRCLHCDCRGLEKCQLRAYAAEYEADPSCHGCKRRRYSRDDSHAQIIYEPGKCIDCGRCISIAERAGEELGLTFIGRGFEVRVAPPFAVGMDMGLQRVARECAEACPTGALVLREER